VLLALQQIHGSHIAVSIAKSLSQILYHFDLTTRLGNIVTDNASENGAYIAILAKECFIKPRERHVLCIGHVINLIAQQVLFRSDVKAFEPELVTTVEALELAQ
jgi:hypothetical protein